MIAALSSGRESPPKATSTPFCSRRCPWAGAPGVTVAASGFGNRRGADGGGNQVVVVTNGMALREITLRVRHSHRLAGRGRFPVVRSVHHHLPAGAASTERSSRPPKRIARRRAVNATVPKKRRSGIVSLVGGAAWTERFSRPLGRIARPRVANATPHRRKRRRIRKIVCQRAGAVSTETSSRVHWKNVRRTAASFSLPNNKRSSIANCVGAAFRDAREES